MNGRLSWFIAPALLAAAVQLAAAQPKLLPKEDTYSAAGPSDVEGWNPLLGVTGTINVVSNSSVVGQVEGTSTLVGVGVVGGADYIKGKQLFRGTLGITESVARTPVVDNFIKTNDVVSLEGLYNRYLAEHYGLFARLQIQTALFPATDIRSEPTTWVRKEGMGMTTILNQARYRQRLADSLAPLTLSQSLGAFFDPSKNEKAAVSIRVGIGAREALADGVLLIDDDKATPEVELLPLADAHQLGAEAFVGVTGKLEDGKLTYRTGLSVLMPFVNNDSFDRSATDLTRIAFEGTTTFNVYEWLSLVYTVSVIRDPQLFPLGDELTQIQNNLLLTFKYALVKKREKDKEPTAEEKALAEAKARAEAAEARLKELESQLDTCTSNCPQATPPVPATDAGPAPVPAPAPPPAPTPTL